MNELIEKLNSNLEKLSLQMEKAGFFDYVSLLQRPWKLIWVNFISGIFRGLGMAIGMGIITVLILTILVYVLKQMLTLPVLGQFFAQLFEITNQYLEGALK